MEEDAGDEQLEGLLDLDDPDAADLMDIDGMPLIDRLRQELAVDKQKQQKLQKIKVPQKEVPQIYVKNVKQKCTKCTLISNI